MYSWLVVELSEYKKLPYSENFVEVTDNCIGFDQVLLKSSYNVTEFQVEEDHKMEKKVDIILH